MRRVRLPVSAAEAFAWHERPGSLERLIPPWDRVQVIERPGGIRDGARVVLGLGRFRFRWEFEQRDVIAGRQFLDIQVRGPFRRWNHLHEFHAVAESQCDLEDTIEYALPMGAPGRIVAGPAVRRAIERHLSYRHRVTAQDLAAHAATAEGALRIAVSGASGLIGSSLVSFLAAGGHEVLRLVRRAPRVPSEAEWNPAAGFARPEALEGLDAVVHLAAASIASGRWTARRRQLIRDSRVAGTERLAGALARLSRPPRALIAASAVGYYGNRGDEILREESEAGRGFLPDLGTDWEVAAAPAERAGVRVVHMRIGIVLTPAGGALARLLVPFRLGLGGPFGDGRAWWSWIALDDVLGLVHLALTHDGLRGPVNAVAPGAVRNAEFTRALGLALGRAAPFRVPAFALRAALGDLADETLLASARVEPARALAAGYPFRFPALAEALAHLLGRRE